MDIFIAVLFAIIVIAIMNIFYFKLFHKFDKMPTCQNCFCNDEDPDMANHWDYRIIKSYDTISKEYVYAIHSVYYDNKGRPASWSENPADPFGTNKDELRIDLDRFLKALDKPILYVRGSKLMEVD